VHTGDSVSIEREPDGKVFRVFLTTIKAPLIMKAAGEDPDPYAWESKEALRKAAIGKRVKVIMEFSKTINERNKDFATVILEKNNKNVACILLEKGLVKTNVSKSGDNASKYLEDLLAAEKKGVDSK
jgi:endonuclease YncB( thermonuclease family)